MTMAAICFLLKGEEILLMEHRSGAMQGWLSVIGGKLEPGETPEDAVRREVAEETGLRITEYRHAGLVRLYEPRGRVTLLDLFVATAFEGEIAGSEEGVPEWRRLADVDPGALIGYLRLLWPLVLAPESLVLGTIQIDGAGEPVRYALQQHRIAGVSGVWGTR